MGASGSTREGGKLGLTHQEPNWRTRHRSVQKEAQESGAR